MFTVYAIVTVARQAESKSAAEDYIGVKIGPVFKNRKKAEERLKELKSGTTEVLQTPHGPIECVLAERGVHPIEIEDMI